MLDGFPLLALALSLEGGVRWVTPGVKHLGGAVVGGFSVSAYLSQVQKGFVADFGVPKVPVFDSGCEDRIPRGFWIESEVVGFVGVKIDV